MSGHGAAEAPPRSRWPRLNYGTLAAAIDGLEVAIPGDPQPRTYGFPPAADGDPHAYLYAWNKEAKDNLPVEG